MAASNPRVSTRSTASIDAAKPSWHIHCVSWRSFLGIKEGLPERLRTSVCYRAIVIIEIRLTGPTDAEGTFRPERIIQIAERFGLDPDQTVDNITVARAWNSEHQHDLLTSLSETFATGQFRLLVVDSICALYRVDYFGRGELSERQQKLNFHLSKLQQMSEEFNLTVFLTNQVQSDPGASALFAGADGRKPIGGHVVAHASTTRVLLRKGRGEERVAKIQDSPGERLSLRQTGLSLY